MNRPLAWPVIVLLVAACSSAAPAQFPPTPNASRAAAFDGPSALPVDTPLNYCLGDVTTRSAVFRIDDGPQFWQVIPEQGKSPELTVVGDPLIVVVYPTGWPGMVTGAMGGTPPTHRPGTWDVCVEVDSGANLIAGAPYIVYANVSPNGARIPTRMT